MPIHRLFSSFCTPALHARLILIPISSSQALSAPNASDLVQIAAVNEGELREGYARVSANAIAAATCCF